MKKSFPNCNANGNQFQMIKDDKKHKNSPALRHSKINTKIQQEVFKCLNNETNRDKFCDFTIVVEDYEFPCHRFLLSACSEFFDALLRSDMKETKEMRVVVHGISPEIVKLILDALYGGIDILIPDNMIDVWNAAHQLRIGFLIALSEDFIVQNINTKNCVQIFKNALLLDSSQVADSALNFMAENFVNIVNSENLSKLTYGDFQRILTNSKISVCTDFKVETILNWCGAGENTKAIIDKAKLQCLGDLLKGIYLAKASSECIANLLTNKNVQENKQALTAVNAQAARILVKTKNNPYSPYAFDCRQVDADDYGLEDSGVDGLEDADDYGLENRSKVVYYSFRGGGRKAIPSKCQHCINKLHNPVQRFN